MTLGKILCTLCTRLASQEILREIHMNSVLVEAIPAFSDNYFWLIYNEGRPESWVVDPGDATPVLSKLKHESLKLTGILITHHHYDHVNGIPALLKAYPDARIIGPKHPRIPWVTEIATAKACFTLLDNISVDCLAVPGHTLEHVAYVSNSSNDDAPMLFCGDTLFSSGCGRLFEGSPKMMWKSLQQLMTLHPSTRVYAAHEYTQTNLMFSSFLLPKNPAISARKQQVDSLRSQYLPSLPTTIGLELETNPFLMVERPEVIKAAAMHSAAANSSAEAVFKIIRQMKDDF